MQLEIIEISSININHRESRSPSALPVPISTKTLRPNRQLEAQTAHRPASTFTKIMAINYLGIMIGFPALLAFALTTLGIRYFFVKREMRNIRTRARDGDEPGS